MNKTGNSMDTTTSTKTDRGTRTQRGPIVVGVDWSSGSQTALGWAAELARESGARVVMAHAIRPIVGTEMAIPPFDYDAYRDNVRQTIEGWSRVLTDVKHENRLLEEDPATALLDLADEANAGLIVVGAHARGKWTPPLLGSVTSKILHNSEHPVAVIPDELGLQPLGRVVVGVDGSPQAERALRWAATSDVTAHRTLYAVSVAPANPYSAQPYFADHPFYPNHPFYPTRPVFAQQPSLATSSREDVAGHTAEGIKQLAELTGSETGTSISADVLIGSPVERLLEEGEDAFAIVLGMSGHGALAQAILGSTGRGVATHTHVPVIFVP